MKALIILIALSGTAYAQGEYYDVRDFIASDYQIVSVTDQASVTRIYLQKDDSLFVCEATFVVSSGESYLFECYDALQIQAVGG